MADSTISDRLALAACPRQRSGATPCPARCVDCLVIARAVAHEIAAHFSELYGGAGAAADTLYAVGCHQPDPPAVWQAIDPGQEAAAIAIARELRGPYV
jgi:hypothetical protein